jgi:hypothetical protein
MILDPDYARIFTQARIVAWQYGFACLAHGSFTRDLDLLLVPWADRSLPDVDLVVKRIAGVAGLQVQGPPSEKPHGRRAWTLLLPGFGEVRWVIFAVASTYVLDSPYSCWKRGSMNSGFSGASWANSSERRTTFSREASSNSLIVAVPDFFP